MGDNIEDTFDNSDGEEREIERPHTPDYHDGRQKDEEVSSEVSDEKHNEQQEEESSKQSPVEPVVDSPGSEAGDELPEELSVHDSKEEVDNESIETTEKGNLEVSKDEECDKEEEKSKDDEASEGQYFPDDEELEEKESTSSNEATSQKTIPEESTDKTKKDVSKNGNEEEEEDLEMPLSPIGDLGLSEPEAAIVDDILKGDVSEMMPGDKAEGKQDDDDDVVNKSTEDDNEDQSVKEGEQEANSSPAVFDDNDDDDDDDDDKKEANSEDLDIQDEERSEPEEAGDQLIADIFGASDEEEEFEGFDQEDIELSKAKQDVESKRSSKAMISDDEDEGVTGEVSDQMVVPKPKQDKSKDDDSDDEGSRHHVWDFDVMMEQKKANRSKRRRKGDGDLISDNDDLVVEMIKQMQQAAEEDRMSNEAKQAATKKLKLLPVILKHLNKADLQFTFIDSGILNGIKDWLSPLPDGSLPHLQIRTGLLKILSAFPALDTGALKMSGLGKAVMYLYRHPKEIRQNKDMAGKLINEWARPIFGVTSNFKSMSREEREERDYQNMSKRRRLSSTDEGSKTPRSIDRALHGDKKAARPGEKGFIMRARVPAPSNKDYVVRPKTNLDSMDFRRNSPKLLSRVDKQMRKFKDRNKTKDATLVTISIEGRKMAL
ncbi:protein IWS1 homolog [Actinia tenebrosa]|uniref:Protein IWS1 homolog n=1 Tax=Actinia tenebrosa TaxID=6105 RepID=A0A6P8HSD8_ACTTE|nr:protein IWS1 homolog [Actinia tenebrosa]